MKARFLEPVWTGATRFKKMVDAMLYYRDLLKCRLARLLSPSARHRPIRILFLSDQISRTNELQFSPYYWFKNALVRNAGLVFRAKKIVPGVLPLASDLAGYDLIALKLQYKTPPEDVNRIAAHVADHRPQGTRLAYFDGIDDLCIHWPVLLDHVNFYVKRHAFRDRCEYLKNHVGSTNLTDYVFHKYGPDALGGDSSASGAVKAEHLHKIILGLTFGMDEWALRLHQEALRKGLPQDRPHDVVCRADIPENWMANLRKPIAPVMERLRTKGRRVITPEKRVSREEFYREMASAKIYISPFGYGEICGRDYECAILGALLIKPDMGHVEVVPDIYRPYETYVPVAWDYADLEEKVDHYLNNPDEKARIASNARAVVDEAYGEKWFVNHVVQMMATMGLNK